MHKTFYTSLLFFLTLSSIVYTNLTVKQHGHKPFVPMMLFAECDDILILQNELNVMENRLAEQTQLLSAIDEGNINFANELAKDHNLNLQIFFQLNSALVKMYEVKLKLLKGRLQSLLRMCDRFVMRSLLITSFQSHGINENMRGRLNRSLLYCKERWRIKSWHKNCCFESFKIKQLLLDSENVANRIA